MKSPQRTQFADRSPEEDASFISRAFFWWLNPFLLSGSRQLLIDDDLYALDSSLSSNTLGQQLRATWSTWSRSGKHPLLWAVLWSYRQSMLSVVLPRIGVIALRFAQPALIHRALTLMTSSDESSKRRNGLGLVGAALFIYGGIAIGIAQYKHRIYRSMVRLRGGLIALIYDATLSLDASAASDAAAVTLMSSDVDRIMSGIEMLDVIWATPIEVGVAIVMLARQLGWACLAPVFIALLCTWATVQLGRIASTYQKIWVDAIQERVAATASVLSGIKAIKMIGVSEHLSLYLQGYRDRELLKSKSLRKVETAQQAAGNLSLIMSPVTTFVVFALLSRSRSESWLDPAKAFTSLSLISLLSNPIVYFTFAVPRFTGSIACYDRIQNYLLGQGPVDPSNNISASVRGTTNAVDVKALEEASLLRDGFGKDSLDYMDDDFELRPIPLERMREPNESKQAVVELTEPTELVASTQSGPLLHMENVSFAYGPTSTPTIRDASLTINQRDQIMLLGPVGSGKSTFLHSLLGETCPQGGRFSRHSDLQIGLCNQEPWLPNTTIQNVILGALHLDRTWYNTVLSACDLETDLAHMPLGDQSICGSQGTTLSGGQKKRIALARALYAKKQLVLLDDVLSGLDQRTESRIVETLFGASGLCKDIGMAVVLVASSLKHKNHFDQVVVLDHTGSAVQQGSPTDFSIFSSDVMPYSKEVAPTSTHDNETSVLSTLAIPKLETEKAAVDPARQHGDLSLYTTYFRAMGFPLTALILFSSILFVACFKEPDLLLQHWSSSESSSPGAYTSFYITSYISLAVLALGAIILFNWLLMVTGMPIASARLHSLVLTTTLHAPYHILASTSSGSLLTRFSQDMSLVDTSLPLALSKAIDGVFTLAAEALLITLASHWTLLLLPPLLVTLYFLQTFYLRTSRQLRLLEIELKAPLYGHFLETLSGLTTIRAFGWTTRYADTARERIDKSQQALYLLYSVQRWLGLVLDLIVAIFAAGVLGFAMLVPSPSGSSSGSGREGSLGVALANILTFSGTLTYVLQAWAELETSIGAVARVRSFVEGTPGEQRAEMGVSPPANWPEKGELTIKDLTARYAPADEPVLKGVRLDIRGGEKVGIVGRTGSGKSSLIGTLLGLTTLENGRDEEAQGKIVIDGIDISLVDRELLRMRLLVVPQETPVWVGTVRENLDVGEGSGFAADELLLNLLRKVGLENHIRDRGGLDSELSPSEWSAGQRQLLGVARVVLKAKQKSTQGGLLLLDEATACLDEVAEAMVMDVINVSFKDWTIIAVAHRLKALEGFHRAIVMDAGKIARTCRVEDLSGTRD